MPRELIRPSRRLLLPGPPENFPGGAPRFLGGHPKRGADGCCPTPAPDCSSCLGITLAGFATKDTCASLACRCLNGDYHLAKDAFPSTIAPPTGSGGVNIPTAACSWRITISNPHTWVDRTRAVFGQDDASPKHWWLVFACDEYSDTPAYWWEHDFGETKPSWDAIDGTALDFLWQRSSARCDASVATATIADENGLSCPARSEECDADCWYCEVDAPGGTPDEWQLNVNGYGSGTCPSEYCEQFNGNFVLSRLSACRWRYTFPYPPYCDGDSYPCSRRSWDLVVEGSSGCTFRLRAFLAGTCWSDPWPARDTYWYREFTYPTTPCSSAGGSMTRHAGDFSSCTDSGASVDVSAL